MYNTIRLLRGYERLTAGEFRKFSEGDTIFGDGNNPEEVTRWDIADKEVAKAELAKHHCSYEKQGSGDVIVDEWALEYAEYDEDGEFVGSTVDYDLAITD